jgi:hypothetical protein
MPEQLYRAAGGFPVAATGGVITVLGALVLIVGGGAIGVAVVLDPLTPRGKLLDWWQVIVGASAVLLVGGVVIGAFGRFTSLGTPEELGRGRAWAMVSAVLGLLLLALAGANTADELITRFLPFWLKAVTNGGTLLFVIATEATFLLFARSVAIGLDRPRLAGRMRLTFDVWLAVGVCHAAAVGITVYQMSAQLEDAPGNQEGSDPTLIAALGFLAIGLLLVVLAAVWHTTALYALSRAARQHAEEDEEDDPDEVLELPDDEGSDVPKPPAGGRTAGERPRPWERRPRSLDNDA